MLEPMLLVLTNEFMLYTTMIQKAVNVRKGSQYGGSLLIKRTMIGIQIAIVMKLPEFKIAKKVVAKAMKVIT